MRAAKPGAGYGVIEVLAVVVLLSALYAFLEVNFDARSRVAALLSSVAQGRLWADTAELARLSGGLPSGVAVTPAAKTPFGGRYRVAATDRAAVVSFDAPFEVRGAGAYTPNQNGKGGVVRPAPSVFAPTLPMHDKVLLYRETPR